MYQSAYPHILFLEAINANFRRLAHLCACIIMITILCAKQVFASSRVPLPNAAGLNFAKSLSSSLSRQQISPPLIKTRLQYRVRLAKPEDIPAINQCNLESLPENYSDQFYKSILARYPRLSFVAESAENQLIGYALGRVEQEGAGLFASPFASSIHTSTTQKPLSFIGHVASIAVHEKYRGHGAAKLLMKCLHYNFATQYSLDTVSLFVRVSNKNARKMYEDVFNYENDRIEPMYYPDNEDACYMLRKNLMTTFDPLTLEEIDLITIRDDY